jgi:hypothetical protein
MAGKKPFINPLTRSSETELHVPIVPDTQAIPQPDNAATTSKSKRTKSREEVFEETHQRFTAWVDKKLKKQFDDLAAQRKVSKSALLDEAIMALLHKQERKPYTRQSKAE